MKIDPGIIVAAAAALIFYLRLIIIQRQRVKRARLEYAMAMDTYKRTKKKNAPPPEAPRMGLNLRWVFIIPGMLLIIIGALFAGIPALRSLAAYWYIPLSVGILVMALGVR